MFDLGEPQPHPGVAWRELLIDVHLSQAHLARETHTSPKHINQIVSGVALPSANLVIQMARVVAYADVSNEYPDEGRRLARLMWTMQSRYIFDQALAAEMGKATR